MKRDIVLYLLDIVEAIFLIENYTKNISKEDFMRNIQLQDSVIRRLEIIGEATKNIPSYLREKYSDIPWKEIGGMRDVLIHAYFGVNSERVWNTITKDFQKLKQQIKKMIQEEKNY